MAGGDVCFLQLEYVVVLGGPGGVFDLAEFRALGLVGDVLAFFLRMSRAAWSKRIGVQISENHRWMPVDSSTGDRNPDTPRIVDTRTPAYGSKREVCIEAGENPAHDRGDDDARNPRCRPQDGSHQLTERLVVVRSDRNGGMELSRPGRMRMSPVVNGDRPRQSVDPGLQRIRAWPRSDRHYKVPRELIARSGSAPRALVAPGGKRRGIAKNDGTHDHSHPKSRSA